MLLTKTKSIFLILSFCLFYTSCETPKFIKEKLADIRFNKSLAEQELSRPKNLNQIPFTLDSEYNYGCPVIKLKYKETDFFFLVDTGCTNSWISTAGIKKIYGSFDNFLDQNLDSYIKWGKSNNIHKINGKSKKQIKKIYADDLKKMNVITTNVFSFDLFSGGFYYMPNSRKLDGTIGMDFLTNHENVTFDFVNKTIKFDDLRLNGSVIPLIIDNANTPYIEFSYQDKKEIGLLDTGNYTFSPRSNIGKDQNHYNFEFNQNFSVAYNGKIKKRFPWLLNFDNIQIGSIDYNNIKGVYSNIWFSSYRKGAQNLLQHVNGIGCEFFRNHVIQFDWKNNEFIIK